MKPLTPKTRYVIIYENGKNHQLCSKKIATVWTSRKKQSISTITIRRNLKKVRLNSCIPRRKPAITEMHHQAHLEWTLVHRNWTTRKWRRGSVIDQTHAKIIQDYVIPTLDEHFSRGDRIFQEDNALPHRSKVTIAACEDAKIAEMKEMVCHHDPLPSNIQVFEKYVKDTCDDILPEYFKKLIESMPQRIEVVIAANGYSINY
ncbi:transposable element Tcb1 transposase [Rhizophagus clarus]|uniref:Transposable element Tcb1 transposase n=1 Tax=Rhizophagus clarus TaxID=94130 RepID=A0A8H3LG44_9GLOM|nr:transposable element Tcb1 transposase [Rhizophagus clarus]